MRTREEISIEALRREHKRLSVIADKAKREADEYLGVGSEMISIHEEFAAIVKAKDHSPATLKKLEALQARQAKADKIRSKDFLKLCDKQIESEMERDSIFSEIQMLEFRMKRGIR